MKSFKSFLKEETMPFANVRSGGMDIEDSAVRDNVNSLLAGMTNGKFVTPYIALERVAKTLANFHIFMPAQTFLQGDSGTVITPINQYGLKMGMNNSGEVVTGPPSAYTIFFEYRMSDCGMFEIFCEVVDEDELDEILTDLEAELNGDTEEDEEDLNEQKFTNRATNKKSETSSDNDAPMKDRATISGGSTPVPSGSFSPRVPTKNTKDLDQMNRDEKGNTVVEQTINEISDKLKKRYVKKAESDKKSAEREADFSERESRTQASPERKKAFGKEAEWLKGIATKRAKGIAMAKKKMEEETAVDLSDVTKNNKTGQLSSKTGKTDLSKVTLNVKTGRLSQK